MKNPVNEFTTIRIIKIHECFEQRFTSGNATYEIPTCFIEFQ